MTVANPDYVIIGTGSAGWVLANRLSEDRKNRVCVIEAGLKDRFEFFHTPGRVEEVPILYKEDFEEAAAFLNRSPRGVATLIHLCVHKLMPLLTESGKIVDNEIASLIRRELAVKIQEEIDLLRRINTGEIDLKGGKVMETKLFDFLKQVVERRTLKKQPEPR